MDYHDHTSEEIVRTEETTIRRSVFDELLPQDNPRVRYLVAAVAVVLALVSFFAIAGWASNPETYANVIASLDKKRDTVMGLVTGSTSASAAITLLPGDVGTPIAEKLLDISADFAIVIGAIYLEKYMLTILGLAAFKILIPVGCVLLAIALLLRSKPGVRQLLFQLSVRLVFFGLAIFAVVPASVAVSGLIEATYESTVNNAVEAMEQTAGEDEAAFEDADSKDSPGGVIEIIQSIPENISNAATGVSQEVQTALNRFIETLAVMIVTSCVIPILVLLFFLWLAKTILGVRIDVPMAAMAPRSMRRLKK